MKTISLFVPVLAAYTITAQGQWKQMSDNRNVKVFHAAPGIQAPGMFDLDIHVVRDFSRRVASAEDVKWVLNRGLTSVYYTLDGIKCRTTYTEKGSWDYTLRYYDEHDLPPNIRHLVKGKYYDYSIRFVTELQNSRGIAHLVKMEDGDEWVTVHVDENDMTEIERIGKL